MRKIVLAKRYTILASIILIVVSVIMGAIFSQFPKNWAQPINIQAVTSLMFTGSIASISITQIGLLCTLPIAIYFTNFSKKRFTDVFKYALFLIPIVATFVMLLWGSYCCLQPASGAYALGKINPNNYSFTGLWIDPPWYSKVVKEIFYSTMLLNLAVAYFVARSDSWQGERWMAFWIVINETSWLYHTCCIADQLTTRPPL